MNYWDFVKKRRGIHHAWRIWTDNARFTSPEEYGRRAGHTEYVLATFKMPTLTETAAHYFVVGPLLPLAFWCLQRQPPGDVGVAETARCWSVPGTLGLAAPSVGGSPRQLCLGYHTKLRRGRYCHADHLVSRFAIIWHTTPTSVSLRILSVTLAKGTIYRPYPIP